MDAARVKELRDAGRSWSQIAKELGQTTTSVRRVYKRYVENKTATEPQLNFPGQETNP
jgi:hypothetical protein